MKRNNPFSYTEFIVGLLLLSLLGIIAIFAPKIAPYSPDTLTNALLAAPSKKHLFGTDSLGRDVFSMVLYGTRTSLLIGILAALLSGIIGVLIGGLSGYMGGVCDRIVSELIHMFLMVPTFFLIIIIVAIYGSSFKNVVIVIGLTGWTRTAKMMRAQAISLKERTFVKSARTLGEGHLRIFFTHILPNGIMPILVDMAMSVSNAILFEASLSFIGLGDPNQISWGKIIYRGKGNLVNGWWICTFAGLFLIATVISFHLIGEATTKALMPENGKEGSVC